MARPTGWMQVEESLLNHNTYCFRLPEGCFRQPVYFPRKKRIVRIPEEIRLSTAVIYKYFQDIAKFPVLTKEQETECAKAMTDAFEEMIDRLLYIPSVWANLLVVWRTTKNKGKSSNKLAEDYGSMRVSAAELNEMIEGSLSRAEKLVDDYYRNKMPNSIRDEIREAFKAAQLSRSLYVEQWRVLGSNRGEKLDKLMEEVCKYRDKLVNHNLRLVVSFAREFSRRGYQFEDLLQEGNIGLIRAAEKFNYAKGFRFSTYAAWWIRQGFMRGVKRTGKTIRLPAHVYDTLVKVNKLFFELQSELGRPPTLAELSKEVGVKPEMLERLYDLQVDPISLDQEITGNDGKAKTLKDYIPDESPDSVDLISELTKGTKISEAIKMFLTPLEGNILRMRFGLGDEIPRTLDDIGKIIGKSRERVRQIETIAIKKLRENAEHLEALHDE